MMYKQRCVHYRSSIIHRFTLWTAFFFGEITRTAATSSHLARASFIPILSPAIKSSGVTASIERNLFTTSLLKLSKMTPDPLSSSAGCILESPSAERNKGPIWDQVLSPIVFPDIIETHQGSNKIRVLELASGCGVHTEHFVSSFLSSQKQKQQQLDIEWQPSDPDPEARSSIDARVMKNKLQKYILPSNGWVLGAEGGTACGDGVRDTDGGSVISASAAAAGSTLDGSATADIGKYQQYFDLVTCINMIHIAPWEATLGLMECAGKVLRQGGMLLCYGPYKVGGTAVESNLKFDLTLRSRNPSWGVRNLEDVVAVAKKEGLEFVQSVEMPANNLAVLFRQTS